MSGSSYDGRSQYGATPVTPRRPQGETRLSAEQYSNTPQYNGRSPSNGVRTLSGASPGPLNPAVLPPQRLGPNGYHPEDLDGKGTPLNRSLSAASSGSSLLPMAPTAADQMSLMSSGISRSDSQATGISSGRYASSLFDQQSAQSTTTFSDGGYTVMPSPRNQNFEYFPPSGADVKVPVRDDQQLQQQFQSHQYPTSTENNEKGGGSRSGQYDVEDEAVPRRLADDHRLHERITDLKQRLGKLEMEGIDDEEYPAEAEAAEGDYFDEEEEEDDWRFINLALLSHIAVRLRDKVPRATHVKGSIPYPHAFTGKDIVVSQLFLPS